MSPVAPKPIYVLHGRDTFIRDAHRKEIVSLLIADADPQVCLSTRNGDEPLADVLDDVRTLPFLAPRRVVIVRDADSFITANRKQLENFLENPPSSGTLILEVLSWKKNTRLHKIVAKVGTAIDCSALEGRALINQVSTEAAKRNKKIDAQAAELLVQWVGDSLAAINTELDKLTTYIDPRPVITPEDVSKIVVSTTGAKSFALINAIVAGCPRDAIKTLKSELAVRGNEFKVMGQIRWHLQRALGVEQMIQSGKPASTAMRTHRIFQDQNLFAAMLKKRGLEKLQEDFRRIIRCDLAMKSGSKPEPAMQELVVKLCT